MAHAFILKNVVTEPHASIAATLSELGFEQLTIDSPAEAASSFRAVIAADPVHFEAHHGLIPALRDSGLLEQSVAAALALTALTPHDPLAHTALSISLHYSGHVPEAEAAVARARILEWKIELQPPPKEGSPQ